jgi:hypothetical protein
LQEKKNRNQVSRSKTQEKSVEAEVPLLVEEVLVEVLQIEGNLRVNHLEGESLKLLYLMVM